MPPESIHTMLPESFNNIQDSQLPATRKDFKLTVSLNYKWENSIVQTSLVQAKLHGFCVRKQSYILSFSKSISFFIRWQQNYIVIYQSLLRKSFLIFQM